MNEQAKKNKNKSKNKNKNKSKQDDIMIQRPNPIANEADDKQNDIELEEMPNQYNILRASPSMENERQRDGASQEIKQMPRIGLQSHDKIYPMVDKAEPQKNYKINVSKCEDLEGISLISRSKGRKHLHKDSAD